MISFGIIGRNYNRLPTNGIIENNRLPTNGLSRTVCPPSTLHLSLAMNNIFVPSRMISRHEIVFSRK